MDEKNIYRKAKVILMMFFLSGAKILHGEIFVVYQASEKSILYSPKPYSDQEDVSTLHLFKTTKNSKSKKISVDFSSVLKKSISGNLRTIDPFAEHARYIVHDADKKKFFIVISELKSPDRFLLAELAEISSSAYVPSSIFVASKDKAILNAIKNIGF
jgi:hypothetical protein